jgi:glycosidase
MNQSARKILHRYRQYFLLTVTAFLISVGAKAQPAQYVHKVVLQAFWWDYWNSNYRYNWCNYLTDLAPRLKRMGVDAIWIPPCVKNGSGGSVGYSPFDMYDLGDKYQKGGGDGIRDSTRCGTKDDLLRMIAVMHANGIEVVFDAVINHNDGAGTNSNAGGIDPEPNYSMKSNNGYKNFRFVSYKTPIINDSLADDYFSRSGRWAKNYQNFHLNPANTFCSSGASTAGDICCTFFGPDADYETPGALGQSTNIPTSGNAIINGISRPYYNPVQTAGPDGNYMHSNVRAWMKWFKRQTNVDGYRFDAVKHFPINVQQNVVTDMKYNLPAWAAGGQDMFCIGEWVGGAGPIDSYVGSVALPAGSPAGEEAVGAFDFSLRGYGTNGGIYSMVLGGGSYNMQYLQYDRQAKRWMDYGNKRVYRSSPFVNSHDTYRPKLDSVGRFLRPLGDASGWDTNNELGGNGRHIDPREPRLAGAYAAAMAFNGNPIIFFEDIFDVGTTGKRWSHRPESETDLPVRADLQNILHAHQKLSFKDADEFLPTNYTGATAPVYNKGTSGDHFVIERKGKAIIGITDAFSSTTSNASDQEVWITVADDSWKNKNLIDYSGAHGLTTSQVFSDGRVLIKTAPAGHNISGARGHGYSIWAPIPDGITFPTVDSMYKYLATYAPPRSPITTQEWEMADDLGDSHCLGLGQGGALPGNSTNERIAGRIYVAAGKEVTAFVTPEFDGRDITFSLYDNRGNLVKTVSGITTTAAPLTASYTPDADGWLVAKVRNSNDNTAGQKVWVRLSYTAPAVVKTTAPEALIPTDVSIWSGNKGTTDVMDCGNWEAGKIPGPASTVMVYGHAKPFPVVAADLTINKLQLFTGAQMSVNPGIQLTILSQ